MEFRTSGFTVGKYEIGGIIGSGTSAKVKLGRNVETGQVVALKVFRRDQEGKYKTLAKQEVDGLRAAKHPCVIKVLDILATEKKLYLVLEYADGGDLLSLMAGGRLGEAEARTFFRQIVIAVNHCHSRGVFHRDLKPENVLLDGQGNLKLADFGLCSLDSQTQHGRMFGRRGTYGYMAPEALERGGYDAATADLWSCGVILFFMLADRLPFDRHDPTFLSKIAAADYDMPAHELSSSAQDLVRRLLVTDPRTRISGAQVLQHAWVRQDADINRPGPELVVPRSDDPTEATDFDTRLDAIFHSNFDLVLTELRPVQLEQEIQQLVADSSSSEGSRISVDGIRNLVGAVPLDTTSKKVFLTHRFPVRELLDKLERSARECGFQVKRKDETLHMETARPWYQWCIGRCGSGLVRVCATADVVEVRSGVAAVLLHKTGGNNSLHSLRSWEQLCIDLQADIVWI